MQRVVAALALTMLFVWAPDALAQLPLVRLSLQQCEHLRLAEVRRIFSAELGSSATDVGGPDVTDVTIVCDSGRVTVRVRDPLSRKTVQRSFDSTFFDQRAEARLVAIAASELVLASWAELNANPRPSVAPEGPPPRPTTRDAARAIVRERASALISLSPAPRERRDPDEPDERVLRALVLTSFRSFFNRPSAALLGGGARIGEERFRFVSWSLDTLFESGTVRARRQTGMGIFEHDVTTVTFGASLLAYYSVHWATFRLGAGLRAGVVSSSSGGQSDATVAPWGWPMGVSVWTFRLEQFVLDLSAEAGYVVLPLQGNEAVRGAWFSGQLGVGMVL